MPGLNTTGTPNTKDYNLGRGIVMFALLEDDLPGAYRDLGNAPEFNITTEVDTLEHESSRGGLRVVDKEVVVSQKMSLSVTIDEVNMENMALFFSGDTASFTNAAIAGFAEHEMISSVVLGRHYDIVNASNARAYDITSAAITVQVGATTLVEDTDYTLDKAMGTIFFLSSATNVTAGDAIDVTLQGRPAAAAVDEVRALTSSSVSGALKFISINPAADDAKTEYQFHKVSLKATGDYALIGNEWTTMQLEGVAEKNETASPLSPTLTIRYPKIA